MRITTLKIEGAPFWSKSTEGESPRKDKDYERDHFNRRISREDHGVRPGGADEGPRGGRGGARASRGSPGGEARRGGGDVHPAKARAGRRGHGLGRGRGGGHQELQRHPDGQRHGLEPARSAERERGDEPPPSERRQAVHGGAAAPAAAVDADPDVADRIPDHHAAEGRAAGGLGEGPPGAARTAGGGAGG